MNRLNLIILIGLALAVSIPAYATIKHRYDFVADANDVVGGLESVLVGNAVVSGGSLILDGVDDWMEMPGDQIAINTYDSFSLEMWYTPVLNGNPNWSMLAYFGGNNATATWMGVNYFFMTTARGDNVSRTAICTGNTSNPWATESGVNGPEYDDGLLHHMVATLSGTEVSFFIDGEFLGSAAVTGINNIANISQELAFLGKGGYLNDPEWNGSIHEFRIYDKALTPSEMRFTHHFGADDAYPIVLRTQSPADGTTKLSVMPAFSWTPEPEFDVASYTLYYGTDPNIVDPNRPDVSTIADVVVAGLLSPAHTVAAANALDYFTDYYWRVDTITVDETVYQGVGMHFQTIAEVPAVTDDPEFIYVKESETAAFTAACESVSSFTTVKWFKAGTPAVEITTADPDVTISNVIETTGMGYAATSTLMIANIDAADLGSYYAEFRNEAGPTNTASAELRLKILLAYWPFENDLIDATGNGYNGTAMSNSSGAQITPIFSTGVAGQAVDLSSTAYIDLVDGLADDFSGGFTFSLWAYPRTAAVWARFLSFNNGQNSDNIFFSRVGVEPTLRLQIVKGTSGTGGVLDASVIDQSIWQMFTVTMAPDGQAVIYENGVPVASGTVQTPNVIARTNNWIGKSAWPDAQFNGLLDDIRIYNYPLTRTEVAKLYTDVQTTEYICVEDENPLSFDVTGDCRVDLEDIQALASWWMDCDRVPASACSF
jgi:hypothetical protein